MTIFLRLLSQQIYNDIPLLTGISFGMESGEHVCIIGSNGVVETTLMRIIAGAEETDDGTVIAFNKKLPSSI